MISYKMWVGGQRDATPSRAFSYCLPPLPPQHFHIVKSCSSATPRQLGGGGGREVQDGVRELQIGAQVARPGLGLACPLQVCLMTHDVHPEPG